MLLRGVLALRGTYGLVKQAASFPNSKSVTSFFILFFFIFSIHYCLMIAVLPWLFILPDDDSSEDTSFLAILAGGFCGLSEK